ncbi:metallophosphoesterase [Patescibacteria group bacterium]|nr:metallophosphoesterase [Patescibacteria group bacterium]
MVRRKKKSKVPKIVNRIFRFFFAIIILSSLVLGVSLVVKEVYVTDTGRFAQIIKPILAKLHIPVSEEQIGDVAGEFVSRLSQTNLASGVQSDRSNDSENSDSQTSAQEDKAVERVLKVALISDIHNDLAGLENAVYRLGSEEVDFLVVVGDLTDYGDVEALSKIKESLDGSGYTYYVLPGDHDLAESVGLGNFTQVFGGNNHYFEYNGINFLLVDNSANFTELSSSDISWIKENIDGTDFVVLSQPIFTDGLLGMFARMYMGSSRDTVEDEDMLERQSRVAAQRSVLLEAVRDSNVIAVIAGDHHRSSKLKDSVRSELTHHVLGAVTGAVNEYPQSVIQEPRFSIMTVFEDKSYTIEDILLE